ncbi:hypothetical protein KXX00_007332 [Aspergillus fumigatus]|nr:hypothetical protein KXW16_007478 [Aspergillus fumigatus]KAH3118318.1 hypothetical protein KXX00_007332 [Aspergillus fumigatus]
MSNARETPTKYAFAAVSEGPSDAATESMRLLLQEEGVSNALLDSAWISSYLNPVTLTPKEGAQYLLGDPLSIPGGGGALPGPPQAADRTWHLRPGNTFLNNVTYLGGHHVFSDDGRKWIESQVGETIDFDKLFSLELHWLKPLRLHANTTAPPALRPNLLIFPVISRSLFEKTLDLAYSPSRPSGSASAKSCVYSFLSLISLFGFDDNIHGATDCQSYASAAQSLLAPVVEEMTVDGLQSLIMLVQLHYFLGDLQSAAVTLSIAARLLIILFYAITAVLTLFCNIISNPRDAEASHNVNLLQMTPGLIRRIPVRKLTLGEVIHLQYLDGFTAELAAICVRAVSKSQQSPTDAGP